MMTEETTDPKLRTGPSLRTFQLLLNLASPGQRANARAVLRSGGVRPDDEHPHDLWWVGSRRDPARTYRVQVFSGLVTCTCAHGVNNGGHARCYHAVAVALQMVGPR